MSYYVQEQQSAPKTKKPLFVVYDKRDRFVAAFAREAVATAYLSHLRIVSKRHKAK